MLSAAEANLAAVAAAEPPTFASVIAPLMAPPHYKTNPLVCQSKFLAHCSTVPEVRAAAEAAGANPNASPNPNPNPHQVRAAAEAAGKAFAAFRARTSGTSNTKPNTLTP